MKNDQISRINEPEESSERTIINHQKGYVALPFEGEKLKDFISGLLGTPQTITKEIEGIYDITLSDIQDLDYLLNQRIIQQNNGKLLQFKSEVFFSDKSSVTLNSLNELQTYNEVKPVVSKAIKLNWSYLIQFSDKSIPEKQEIEIIFTTQHKEYDNLFYILPLFLISKAKFEFRIEHTARTWGTDIESLLTNKIESMRIKPTAFQLFYQSNASIVANITAALIFIFSSYIVINRMLKWNESKILNNESFLKSSPTLNQKLDFAINLLNQNILIDTQAVVLVYYTAFILLGFFISTYLRALLKKNHPSFLTLTKESVIYKTRMLEKHKMKTFKFWVSVIVAVSINLGSSYIFEHLMK